MSRDTLLKILDLARWAPSGDNTQPWRFEIAGEDQVVIHGSDTRDHVVYDFDGHASHMAHGALIETLRIAATRFGLAAKWRRRPETPDTGPIYDITLHSTGLPEDPLASAIEERCVQRRPMRTTALTAAQRAALVAAVGSDYELQFFESFPERFAVSRLLWASAHLRLTCPEAYRVHREVIEWNARFSNDRIPDQAVGVDPLTAVMMRWVMQSWRRVVFFNRYLMGTIPPRIQLDFLPGLRCAAHILMRTRRPLDQLEDYVAAGVALQRLWLTATLNGLHLQPEMTPVIFRWYANAGRSISTTPHIDPGARRLARRFETLAQAGEAQAFAFFCRVGSSGKPHARSLREELARLFVSKQQPG